MSAKVTAKAVSQVRNQLPAFIGDEFPLYQKFMEHYYEFLEAVCIYYTIISDYGSAFTVGETVTGQTSGATAKVKGRNAMSATLKVFLEPTNDLDLETMDLLTEMLTNYKVWGKKKFMGREFMGLIRSTFLLKDNKIIKEWRSVKVKDHAKDVLNFLKSID